jgi:hypothetical protein
MEVFDNLRYHARGQVVEDGHGKFCAVDGKHSCAEKGKKVPSAGGSAGGMARLTGLAGYRKTRNVLYQPWRKLLA